MRPRGPAAAPPPLAGAPPARGRAGRPGGARPVPAGLAGRRRRSGERRPPFRGTAALERLAEVVDQLAGVPIPASVLERDVLPARIPGYQPRLLDELGRARRGRLGRARAASAATTAGSRWSGPAARSCGPVGSGRRHSSARRSRGTSAIREHLAARGASFYRELFAAAGGGLGPRGPRCAVGPGLGRRGHQRHVRAAPRPALEADRRGGGNRRPRAGPADRPRPARGRRPLVARRAEPRRRLADGAAPRPEPRAARAARRADPRSGRVGGHRGRVQRRLPGPARDGGGRPDPARLLRRWPRRGAVRARRRARPAARRARGGRRPGRGARSYLLAAADPANPYGAALPWPRRGETDRRPLQRAAGAYVVLVDGVAALYLERGGATLQTLARVRRPGRAAVAARALGDARRSTAGSASSSSARSTARPSRDAPVARRSLLEAGLRRRLSRASTLRRAARLTPECPKATRSTGRRPVCGRTSWVAPSPRPGRAVRAPSRRSGGSSARRSPRSSRVGKNLLIRFDNGLELRTHLRMNGSWHRYRPGERWRRPPARARLVLEVPGAVAVCFDAPVVELLEQRAEALHPALAALGPGPAVARLRCRRGAPPAARPEPRADDHRRGPPRPAGAGRASATSTRARPCSSNGSRRSRRRVARRRDPRPPGRDRASGSFAPTSRRRGRRGTVTTTGDRGAPGPLYVYGRAGRPCRRCRTPIAARAGRATELRGRPTGARPANRPADRAAYHRARCASTSSPGPANPSASTSCGRSPRSWSGTGSPDSAGARPGSATTAAAQPPRPPGLPRRPGDSDGRAPPRRRVALVHLRRPSKLSTLTGPDTQPFDDPAGRFAFSHNGDLRDYRALRATYRAQGRIHGRADTEVGARWLEDAWDPDERPEHLLAALHDRFGGQANLAVLTADGRAAPLRGQRREPGLQLPPRPDRDRQHRDLLARPLAVPVRRSRRDRPPPRPAAYLGRPGPRRKRSDRSVG